MRIGARRCSARGSKICIIDVVGKHGIDNIGERGWPFERNKSLTVFFRVLRREVVAARACSSEEMI